MVNFRENVLLESYSNYKIGGPARYFFEAGNEEELRAAVGEAKKRGLPIFILGGGTNLLISDVGFNGLVVKLSFGNSVHVAGNRVTASADVPFPKLLEEAVAHNLSGLEWAGGLPGTVGGAVRGNAGAFGGETKDVVASVRSYDMEDDSFVERGRAECRFGYRTSVFKEKNGKEIITRAVFELRFGEGDVVRAAATEKINFRQAKHPLEHPNVGSIFKNVPASSFSPAALSAMPVKNDPFPVVPTAYLISEAGLKGGKAGGAMISPKHPNFIVNTGGATAADVEILIRRAKTAVFEKFGIRLEEEIQRVP